MAVWLPLSFLLGAIAAGPAWILVGAIVADNLNHRRRRRRREQIDLDGADATEAWLTAADWTRLRPTNGTPFEGDEVA